MAKPNCYRCQRRKNVHGSRHSSCSVFPRHIGVAIFMAATIIVDEVHFDGGAVIGKLEGFGNCWFDWPLDFDPYWLLECSYFKPKNGIVFA